MGEASKWEEIVYDHKKYLTILGYLKERYTVKKEGKILSR